MLKLPTPAGRVVANAAGLPPVDVAPVAGQVADTGRAASEAPGAGRDADAPRRGWRLRGWITQEENLAQREDTILQTDTWSRDSWRLDASLIRLF